VIAGAALVLAASIAAAQAPPACYTRMAKPERAFDGIYFESFEGYSFAERPKSTTVAVGSHTYLHLGREQIAALGQGEPPSFGKLYRVRLHGFTVSREEAQRSCGERWREGTANVIVVTTLLLRQAVSREISFDSRR